jgi:hypothetical protein
MGFNEKVFLMKWDTEGAGGLQATIKLSAKSVSSMNAAALDQEKG